MGAIEEPAFAVVPLPPPHQRVDDAYLPDIRDGCDDRPTRAQPSASGAKSSPWVNHVLQDVVEDNGVEGRVIRHVRGIATYDDAIQTSCGMLRGISVWLDAPDDSPFLPEHGSKGA